jgi:aerobic carbon-monoxide dehydrogenase small subunit
LTAVEGGSNTIRQQGGVQNNDQRSSRPQATSRDFRDPDPPLRQKGVKAMPTVTMTVNGRQVSGEAEPRTLLVQFLRDTLGLTGTHVGCDTSQCGSCVVHLDGLSVKSCTMLAVQADGASVTTIEGLSNGELHPMQAAFREHHGLQCGFCTPGMVMSAIDLVNQNPSPSEHDIREWLDGNICRCTGYHNIVKAVKAGAAAMKG